MATTLSIEYTNEEFVCICKTTTSEREMVKISWETLFAASTQADEGLARIYRAILTDARAAEAARLAKEEDREAREGWYALVTFGTPSRSYEVPRVGQGLAEMRRLIAAGQEMLGTGGQLAVTCARVSRFPTRAKAEAYDISMSGGTCVWQS
ncbi:MAG TPA: hypothetical protein VF765_18750 [Polyangiaceae bacterium]